MRDKFIKWLISYKTYGLKAASNIVSTLDALSDEMNKSGVLDKCLFNCSCFVDYAKCRREIHKIKQLSKGDVKTLDLLGDFYQFSELTSVKIEVTDERLIEYCKAMKMSYSYKPVLIMALVKLDISSKPCKLSNIVEYFINYYTGRSLSGKIVEKDDSIFSKTPIDVRAAQKIIINNPISILVKDGVILFDKVKMEVRLSSAYTYDSSNEKSIIDACEEKIDEYYSKIKLSPCFPDKESIDELFVCLEENLAYFKGGDHYNACTNILAKIKKKLGISSSHSLIIEKDDPRKIGALVKETMLELSNSQYAFSEEELLHFMSLEWSKKVLGLYYPFFLCVNNIENIKEIGKDHLGKNRYWNIPYDFNGKTFLITSQWYVESREKYIEWFNTIMK